MIMIYNGLPLEEFLNKIRRKLYIFYEIEYVKSVCYMSMTYDMVNKQNS